MEVSGDDRLSNLPAFDFFQKICDLLLDLLLFGFCFLLLALFRHQFHVQILKLLLSILFYCIVFLLRHNDVLFS